MVAFQHVVNPTTLRAILEDCGCMSARSTVHELASIARITRVPRFHVLFVDLGI